MPATVEIEPAFLGIVKAYDHKGDEILPDGKGVITLDHDLQYPPETKHPRESGTIFCGLPSYSYLMEDQKVFNVSLCRDGATKTQYAVLPLFFSSKSLRCLITGCPSLYH